MGDAVENDAGNSNAAAASFPKPRLLILLFDMLSSVRMEE
jgi:hypothetical protein